MSTNQRITTTVDGPIDSNGAGIYVTHHGTIDGGPTGVAALAFSITTLADRGAILGGVGGPAGDGGVGVLNDKTIGLLRNTGLIAGGAGGTPRSPRAAAPPRRRRRCSASMPPDSADAAR